MGDKILITGAGGFVGGRLTEVLHFTQDKELKAGVRNTTNCMRIGRLPIDIVKCNLLNITELEHAVKDVSIIIHCAKGSSGATDIGTKNLLEVALNNDVKRFIHLSTTEVYGNSTGEIYEDNPYDITGSEYNISKINAEKYCFEYMGKGIPITIIRPPIIYGPYGVYWTIYFANVLINGQWRLYNKYGEGYCNLLYVDDLVRAILMIIKNQNSIGQIYNINGPEIITWNEYFQRFNKQLGLGSLISINPFYANLKTVFMQPIRIIGRYVRDNHLELVKKISRNFSIMEQFFKKTESKIKFTPGPDDLNLYNRKVIYKISKAEEMINFKPKFNINYGLNISVSWLNHHGFLL